VTQPIAVEAALRIRTSTETDLEAIVDLYLAVAQHHAAIDPELFHVPARDAVRDRLLRRIGQSGDRAENVVAIVGDEIVGNASIDIGDPPAAGSILRPVVAAEIGVGLAAEWRGRGIGTALIRHLEGWAREHGVERIGLVVADANVDAIRLYRRLGYVDSDHELRKVVRPA
jgi:GNAT superfamily N-acetyltransferase